MTNKLLNKYGIDVFFISIGVMLIISIIQNFDVVDIAYFLCVVYYYVRIKLCKWGSCN